MAQDLSNASGIEIDPDYVNGKIKDKQTRVNAFINQDIIQFFQKLMSLAGITANNDFDNESNGYQFIDALIAKIRDTSATTTLKGTVEKATTAEAQAGTVDKFLDAALLQLVTATTSRNGVVEKATTAEAQAGTVDKFLDAALLQLVTALETRKGVAQIATTAEAIAGTNDTKIMTPKKVADAVSGGILMKEVDIGDWNMDLSPIITVNIGVAASKFRGADVMIYNDAGTSFRPLNSQQTAGVEDMNGSVFNASGTSIDLVRTTGGAFDSADYNATSYNRGKITVRYIE